MLLLGFPERFSMPLLGLIAQNGRDEQVAPFAYFDLDALDRHIMIQALEGSPPSLDVSRVGVDERAIDVEDDSVYRHCLR
jgi:hypothetical protein